MVSSDGHEWGEIDVHIGGLQIIVLAILHDLCVDAVRVFSSDEILILDAICRIFLLLFRPEKHVAIVHRTHKDVLVDRLSLQSRLCVGIFLVGAIILIGVAVAH